VILRRIFYSWQFIAVVVLPVWLLVGATLFGDSGWAVVGTFFAALGIGFALLVVSLLIFARAEVRSAKAVSWADAGVLSLWHGLIVAAGVAAGAAPELTFLVLLVGLAAFWFTLWELLTSARRRMQAMINLVDATAQSYSGPLDAGHLISERSTPSRAQPGPAGPRAPTGTPPVIVIQEKTASQPPADPAAPPRS
jgi:hypothetical protein